MPVTLNHHTLFPTLLTTVQHDGPEIDRLNDELFTMLTSIPQFRADDPEYRADTLAQYGSDDFNFVDYDAQYPCVKTLLQLFARAVDAWLEASGQAAVAGHTSAISLFPSYLGPGEATSPHNHSRTELVGTYYVRCEPAQRPLVEICGHSQWYRQDDGALLLLDPRFNATLTELSETMCAKLHPRPGLLVIFPGYLWHAVSPNLGRSARFAVAANIGVTRNGAVASNERRFQHPMPASDDRISD
jgi:hypothetical protein